LLWQQDGALPLDRERKDKDFVLEHLILIPVSLSFRMSAPATKVLPTSVSVPDTKKPVEALIVMNYFLRVSQ
jgi:hypothetical protein